MDEGRLDRIEVSVRDFELWRARMMEDGVFIRRDVFETRMLAMQEETREARKAAEYAVARMEEDRKVRSKEKDDEQLERARFARSIRVMVGSVFLTALVGILAQLAIAGLSR